MCGTGVKLIVELAYPRLATIYEYINCAASGVYTFASCLTMMERRYVATLKLSSVINYVIRGGSSEKRLNLMTRFIIYRLRV